MFLKLLVPAVAIAAVFVCGPAFAQSGTDDAKVDCANTSVQSELNICADRAFDKADKALNVQYKKARAAMVALDANLSGELKGAEKALVKAQRAWVDYRDGECESQGFQMRGGSAEPMVVSGCKESLTKQRTKELKELADGPEANQ